MKSIIRLAIIALAMTPFFGFAQEKKAAWPEMKNFHSFMSSTFHPAEEGNLQPLKAKAADLLKAAQEWKASKVPDNFILDETTVQLEKLVKYCTGINEAVSNGTNDATLTQMITEAHDVFHKIAGECRKADH